MKTKMMYKINSFFGYFLFRLINRWKSSSIYVNPEVYASIIFNSIITLPIINLFVIINKLSILHYTNDEIVIMSAGLYILFVFYSMYLESWLKKKKNTKPFIYHKWNKYPVEYINYFYFFNILFLIFISNIL